jgi:hypothetical protein
MLRFFFILLLFVGCQGEKLNDSLIVFEYILGPENSETLSILVQDFETDFLANQYPKLTTTAAYEQFLIDLRDHNTKNFRKISSESRALFKSSDLRAEIYEVPDTVWIEHDKKKIKLYDNLRAIIKIPHSGPWLIKRYRNTFDDSLYHSVSELYNHNTTLTNEEIIRREYNTATINNLGKYWFALRLIGDKHPFIKAYHDKIQEAGMMQVELTIYPMLAANLDYSHPLVKRIIVMEYAY